MNDLERIAKAVFRSGFHPDDSDEVVAEKWEYWPEDRRSAFRQARAAISALMTPSEGMVRAGVDYRLHTEISGTNNWPGDTERLLRVMLEHVLNAK